jgi:hypothetical protein
VQEVQLAEVLDHGLLHAALEGEVELFQRLAGGEGGRLDAALAAVAVARGDLGCEQRLGEAFVAPLFLVEVRVSQTQLTAVVLERSARSQPSG